MRTLLSETWYGIRWVLATMLLLSCSVQGATLYINASDISSVAAGSVSDIKGQVGVLANWVSGQPVPTNKHFSAGVVYSNELYLVGGDLETNVFKTADGTNWTEIAGVNRPNTGEKPIAVVAHGFLYVWTGASQTNFCRWDNTTWVEMQGVPTAGYLNIGVVTNRIYALRGGSTDFVYYNEGNNTWESETACPVAPVIRRSCTLTLDNKLYYFNGDDQAYAYNWDGVTWNTNDNFSDSTYYYFSGSAIGENGYVVGLGTEPGGSPITNVYRSLSDGNNWNLTAALPLIMCQGTAPVWNGKMYFWGGISGNAPRTNLYIYTPDE